jgi:hypothetical protein
MGVGDSVKDFYFAMEDKWYSLVDRVSDKISFVGRAVDGLEDKGVPTFPLAIIVLILIILLVAFLVLNTGSNLTIIVKDTSGDGINGATVTVLSGSDTIAVRNTDVQGKIIFYLPNGEYDVRIEKTNYNASLLSSVLAGEERSIILESMSSVLTKAISLKTGAGILANGSGTVLYSCLGSSEQFIATYNSGVFNANFSDCTEIIIDSVSGYNVIAGRASFSGTEDVVVEVPEENVGTITVNLSSDETVPAGIRVILTNEDNSIAKPQYTQQSGVVIFNDIPTGTYHIVISDARFEDYDGSNIGDTKELRKDETISFNIALTPRVLSTITINVKDSATGAPVIGAEVRRMTQSNQDNADLEVSGTSGQVTFDVSEGSTYIFSAEHPDYLIGDVKTVAAGQTATFNLVAAEAGNAQSLLIRIIDTIGEPINNVHISLKKLDDTRVSEKTTGAEGTAEFFNLELGNYYVYASKAGFASATSPSVQVLPRRQSELDVTLDIGRGDIVLTVMNGSDELMEGANVSAINYYTSEVESEQNIGSDGRASFNLRADKKVYFVVDAPGYLNYYTSSIMPDVGSSLDKKVVLAKSTGRLDVEILGVTSVSGEELGGDRTVSAGTYIVRTTLEVPSGNFDEAGIHLRTGKANEGTTNIMEEDNAYIGDVYSFATRGTRGTTFSPPNGYGVDLDNVTSSSAKWINNVWKNPGEGIYELEAELVIADVPANTGVNLWYRAWAKGGATLRDPTSNPTTELYASANNYLLNGGNASLCDVSFCKSNSIETLTGSNAGRTQYITNSFNASQGNTYRLKTALINRRAISGAVLKIEGSGMVVNETRVNGLIYDDETIELGTMGEDKYTELEIEFTTNSSGAASLQLLINSSTATELEETIAITIRANKTFTLDVIPRQIIPFITNTLFFETTDGDTPLNNTLIEIKSNEDILDTIETNGEGLAQYELASPLAGDVITITARKEGYDDLVISKDVLEQVLIVVPPVISETIKIGEVASIEEMVILENATVKDLEIKRVAIDGELSNYLDIRFLDTLQGEVIASGADGNYNLKIKPNSTAQRLAQPRTVQGRVVIDVTPQGTTQTFTNEIPVTIRLSMPGYLDNENCLKITPTTLEFVASTTEQIQTVEIENTCTAEGTKVNLHNLEAKLNETSRFGNISVTGTELSGRLISDTYGEIDEILQTDAKITAKIVFAPNTTADAGTQELELTIRGTNIADEGETETIEARITLDVSMSNLSRCIEIDQPAQGVVLEVAGWNLGYNRIVNSNLSSYAQNYQGFGGSQSRYGGGYGSMPYGMGQALPFMQQQGNTSTYEQNSFTIKNNCAVDIEIDLDADSRITVGEEDLIINRDSDATVTLTPGYMLGRYKVKVNAKVANTEEIKRKIETVDVTVRRLGESDPDCIKTNVTTLNFNSFLYTPQKYKVYNYCYNSGHILNRANAVSIQCDALNVKNNTDPRFYQTGYEESYRATSPINNQMQSYYDYLKPQGCQTNTCALISGVRTFEHRIVENGGQSIEELTFEVRPSSNYIQQRKLFDEKRGSYGAFSAIADVRVWGTETNNRTNVYGLLNVSYSNQYGSQQCMQFPIEVEDIYRITESIDAAINWGDPNARPQDCVKDRKDDSLNLVRYWGDKGSDLGVIPESEFSSKGKYMYIAEPPAVRIGPAPTTNYYPYNPQNRRVESNATKNCGLMDTLSNLKYDNEFEGVKLKVLTTNSGSLTKNTRGPNLMLSIDRSGIKNDCVIIQTPVTATLRRAVNSESGQVGWTLRAIVTRPGYTIKGKAAEECVLAQGTDLTAKDLDTLVRENYGKGIASEILKAINKNEKYKGKYTLEQIKAILNRINAATVTACANEPDDYGFDLIGLTSDEEIPTTRLDTYCEDKFCNDNMLELFLRDKYKNITKAVKTANGKYSLSSGNGKMSELYNRAGMNGRVGSTTYYTTRDNDLIAKEFVPKANGITIDAGREQTIAAYKDKTLDGTALASTELLLEAIKSKFGDEIMLKMVNSTSLQTELKSIGFELNGQIYIELDRYLLIITAAKNNTNQSTIELTTPKITITKDLMTYIAENANLVKVISTKNPAPAEQEEIYEANPLLNAIRKETRFTKKVDDTSNKAVYLSNITGSSSVGRTILGAKALSGTTNYVTDKIIANGTGKYDMTLDFDYLKVFNDASVIVNVTLSNKTVVGKSADNPLLYANFELKDADSALGRVDEAVLVSDDGELYARAPVKLLATLRAGETAITYSPINLTQDGTLIKWYNGKVRKIEVEARGETALTQTKSASAKSYNGIYYYPASGELEFNTMVGGEVVANGMIMNTSKGTTVTLPGKAQSPLALELVYPTKDNPKKIIDLVIAKKVCIANNGTLYWNENEIVDGVGVRAPDTFTPKKKVSLANFAVPEEARPTKVCIVLPEDTSTAPAGTKKCVPLPPKEKVEPVLVPPTLPPAAVIPTLAPECDAVETPPVIKQLTPNEVGEIYFTGYDYTEKLEDGKKYKLGNGSKVRVYLHLTKKFKCYTEGIDFSVYLAGPTKKVLLETWANSSLSTARAPTFKFDDGGINGAFEPGQHTAIFEVTVDGQTVEIRSPNTIILLPAPAPDTTDTSSKQTLEQDAKIVFDALVAAKNEHFSDLELPELTTNSEHGSFIKHQIHGDLPTFMYSTDNPRIKVSVEGTDEKYISFQFAPDQFTRLSGQIIPLDGEEFSHTLVINATGPGDFQMQINIESSEDFENYLTSFLSSTVNHVLGLEGKEKQDFFTPYTFSRLHFNRLHTVFGTPPKTRWSTIPVDPSLIQDITKIQSVTLVISHYETGEPVVTYTYTKKEDGSIVEIATDDDGKTESIFTQRSSEILVKSVITDSGIKSYYSSMIPNTYDGIVNFLKNGPNDGDMLVPKEEADEGTSPQVTVSSNAPTQVLLNVTRDLGTTTQAFNAVVSPGTNGAIPMLSLTNNGTGETTHVFMPTQSTINANGGTSCVSQATSTGDVQVCFNRVTVTNNGTGDVITATIQTSRDNTDTSNIESDGGLNTNELFSNHITGEDIIAFAKKIYSIIPHESGAIGIATVNRPTAFNVKVFPKGKSNPLFLEIHTESDDKYNFILNTRATDDDKFSSYFDLTNVLASKWDGEILQLDTIHTIINLENPTKEAIEAVIKKKQ